METMKIYLISTAELTGGPTCCLSITTFTLWSPEASPHQCIGTAVVLVQFIPVRHETRPTVLCIFSYPVPFPLFYPQWFLKGLPVSFGFLRSYFSIYTPLANVISSWFPASQKIQELSKKTDNRVGIWDWLTYHGQARRCHSEKYIATECP